MKDNFKLVVPGKPEYICAVRLAISSLANNAGFDIEAIEDIKVAVSEACTNIIMHGHNNKEMEYLEYEVRCEIFNNKLSISVEDEGKGYDLKNYKEPDLTAENTGGLGLFIIRTLMDEVVVESETGVGTHIKMVKYIQEM